MTNRYLYGPAVDMVLADEQLNPDGTLANLFFPLADHQGTIRDIARRHATLGAEVVNHIRYDSFGQIISETAPSIDHAFAFTGREWDADALLFYYRARWYDPAVGRFISEDPISFLAGDANLNRYVGNDPVNATDPSGLEGIWDSISEFFFGDKEWERLIDEERRIVRSLNQQFGTKHTRLDRFTPQERRRIEAALGQQLPWDGGAIRAVEKVVAQRPPVLTTAEVAAHVADGASTAADVLTGGGKKTAAKELAEAAIEAAGRNAAGTAAEQAAKNSDTLSKSVCGPYADLPDPRGVGPGKDFTTSTKKKILEKNREKNGGVLRDDDTGQLLVPSQKSKSGVTPPANEAQLDHVVPKKPKDPSVTPGTNSPDNAKVISRARNRAKSNN